jgi:hypothetical protein
MRTVETETGGSHMIDVTVEEPISLKEATRLPFLKRHGRKIHFSTVYRWSTVGCRGVILDTINIGNVRCTSKEALLRFFAALSTPRAQATFSSAAKRRQDLVDARELEEAGI